jgi:RHS repeat-associated protein
MFQLSATQPVILNGYDSENRMVSTETAGNTRIDNRYDPLHRRVLKRVSTWDSGNSTWVLQKTVRFTYDRWNVIEEEEITASSTRTVRYTWGRDVSGTMQGAGGVGGLLRSDETIGTNPVSTHYSWYDGNGNVTGLMRSNGTIDAIYRYTAFGGKASVAYTVGTFGERNRYRFSTKYLDDEVETVEGTYYYGYRHYLTALGKWGARDPIGERGGVNLYGMVSNRALGLIDVLGLNMYDTKDAAGDAGAQAALEQTNSQPKGEGKIGKVEYCGLVCEKCEKGEDGKPVKKYYYTGPVRGMDTQEQLDKVSAEWSKKLGEPFKAAGTCDPDTAPACSGKDKKVGEFHSHPNGQVVSKGDKDRAKDLGIPDYVGRRASGLLKKPQTDRANPDGTVTENVK